MLSSLELKIIPVFQVAIAILSMRLISVLTPDYALLFKYRRAVAIVFVMVGLFVGVSGIVSFKRAQTTVNPSKPTTSSALVTSGIFQYSRNPMYVGLVCLLLAWAAWQANLYTLLVIPLFMAYMTRFQIKAEERALTQLFGDTYITYMQQVRRWL